MKQLLLTQDNSICSMQHYTPPEKKTHFKHLQQSTKERENNQLVILYTKYYLFLIYFIFFWGTHQKPFSFRKEAKNL